ncbi:DMT family transporter [Lentilitoribacter sp. Alg239-R112]|uniref:DMT family transporter n=1 Tax=Lentilitoribacter sp. Alg239-R112 TaxID=2305987 RepID=UPI0013A6D4C9|nr:DMT family transporter [Lentilitoribacter sp. Alg239-R112]
MSKSLSIANAWPWAVFALTPLFFSTNLIFGRGIIFDVAPFTIAFLRWAGCLIVLLPIIIREKGTVTPFLKHHFSFWLMLGFLGMWICGAIVYMALQTTTAINSALVYTTSPLFVIIIQFLWTKRPIKLQEIIGIVAATIGVCYIVLKGELEQLLALNLNFGDLLILGCAVSWALYLILQKTDAGKDVPSFAMLGLMAAAGTILLAPFAAFELFSGARMPTTQSAWLSIGGIVFFSSLLAFSGTQHTIKHLGPAISSMALYLLPVYGVLLAVIMLDEKYHTYHFIGSVLVLGGVIVATLPKKLK